MAFPMQEFIECIRISIMDSPENNDLLTNFEFDEKYIELAIKRAVNRINATPPIIPGLRIKLESFDTEDKYLGLIPGVLSYLYQGGSIKEKRNELQYSDEGQTINEDHRYSEYLQYAQMQMNEFDQKIKAAKNILSEEASFGCVSSSSFFNYFY